MRPEHPRWSASRAQACAYLCWSLALLSTCGASAVDGIGLRELEEQRVPCLSMNAKQGARRNLLQAPTPAPAPGPGGQSFVALGDSYSAGVGAGPLSAPPCQQAPTVSWPYLLSAALGIPSSGFVNVACNGATSQDVQNSQLSALSPNTNLITITIGGNDVGFTDLLQKCAEPGCDTSMAQQAISVLPGTLKTLYQAIQARAPNAKVYVVGYPNILPTGDCGVDPDSVFSDDDLKTLGSLLPEVSNAIQQAIAGLPNFVFVDTVPAFNGHQICTDDAWINGIDVDVSSGQPIDVKTFHPNGKGQQAFASTVLSAIRGAPTPASAPA